MDLLGVRWPFVYSIWLQVPKFNNFHLLFSTTFSKTIFIYHLVLYIHVIWEFTNLMWKQRTCSKLPQRKSLIVSWLAQSRETVFSANPTCMSLKGVCLFQMESQSRWWLTKWYRSVTLFTPLAQTFVRWFTAWQISTQNGLG